MDGEKDSIGYEAYNAEGYHLNVSYMDFSEEISIRLESPKGDGDLVWPTIGPATLIPQPDSSKGSIEINSHIQLVVYVGETSQDDYNDYVEQCIEWGFNVDYNRSDSVFDADNEIGDSLRVEYQGNNIMYISVYVHDSVVFEEGTDRDVAVENFAFSLPNYWEEEGSKNEYLQYYAEKGDQVVMLSIAYPEEPDDEYDVSFEGLYADNDNMVKTVGAMFTDGNVFNYEVFESDYGVKGVLYHFTYSQNMDLFENVDGHGYLFCFPSETDRRWFYITLLYTNNVTNSSDYVDDYMTLLSTIEETV